MSCFICTWSPNCGSDRVLAQYNVTPHTLSASRYRDINDVGYLQLFFPALRALCYKDTPCPVGGVTSLCIDSITLGEVHDVFLSTPHPHGFFGHTLTSLSFDEIVFSNASPAGVVTGHNFKAAERWAFCRAIGKLRKLKKLCISQAAWADITACGMDVTAPLRQLHAFVVADVSDGSTIMQVRTNLVLEFQLHGYVTHLCV